MTPVRAPGRRASRKRSYPLAQVYRLLEPGPVVLMTTSREGRPNVMPMAWHTMLEFEPPLVGCVVSDRDFSYGTLVKTRACAINVPTADLARTVVACGRASGRRVDKFRRFGLTPAPASRIAAPLVAECYASLECRVVDTRFVPTYGFFVLEVIAAWVDRSRRNPRTLHHRGRGLFAVAGSTLRLRFPEP